MYTCFLSAPGLNTCVAFPLMNIHFFFIVCVSTGAFCAFLHESYGLDRVPELSSYVLQTESLRLLGLIYTC